MDLTRLGDCIGSQGMADDEPKAVKVFGKTGSPQCYAIRDFLYRNDVPFDWTELRTDEDNSAIGLEGGSDGRLPVRLEFVILALNRESDNVAWRPTFALR